jgi:hypothetical protein
MKLKQLIAKYYAAYLIKKRQKWLSKPVETQHAVLTKLIKTASETAFGKDHRFSEITNYETFKQQVPLADYEQLRPYIDRMVSGESDVLWVGKPAYIAKTSGTTSGAKYIPISKESMPAHISSAKLALLSYVHETAQTDFIGGKMIFLQGSPVLEEKNGIMVGRLSGIVAHHVPGYLQANRMPSFETNCIEDWETKVEKIVDETMHQDMRLISGIPSWVQMYFEKLLQKTGKKNVLEVFPNFSLFVYGGVNFEPYRERFNTLIGKRIPSIETYPASEGFIAYQDSQTESGLLLELNSGIFYEFIPTDSYFSENPVRLSIGEVELGINYAIVLNTNAGLWGYSVGDTVKFVSKNPYRIVVTGRIKHYISAFGEHVIGEEVERAITSASAQCNAQVVEFTVAPQVSPAAGLPYHEWYIEFSAKPKNMEQFAWLLDAEMQKQNSYYFDLISGKVLRPLSVNVIQKGGFEQYMKSVGKLGGQNKIQRLGNDRNLADKLSKWTEPGDFTT